MKRNVSVRFYVMHNCGYKRFNVECMSNKALHFLLHTGDLVPNFVHFHGQKTSFKVLFSSNYSE